METDTELLLKTRLRLPDHVVHRTFVAETVILNLKSGKYHGLNPTAGMMLEALSAGQTVEEAARSIASKYEEDAHAVTTDMLALCRGLLDRGLVEYAPAGHS